MFFYLKTTMLRYVTFDSLDLEFLINYDYRVRTAAK